MKKPKFIPSNHGVAIRFDAVFQRLLSREDLDPHENELSGFFEFMATRLLGNLPSRKAHYFDGTAGLTALVKTARQIHFHGEMWVGQNLDQWTEPFEATVTDKRITKEGIWIVLQVGEDRAEGEVITICAGTTG